MQAVGASGDVIRAVADAAGGRVLFSYGTGSNPGDGAAAAQNLDRLCEGRAVTAISHVRGSGFLFGLQCALPMRGAAWQTLKDMDFDARLEAIDDAELVSRLIADAKAEDDQPECALVDHSPGSSGGSIGWVLSHTSACAPAIMPAIPATIRPSE